LFCLIVIFTLPTGCSELIIPFILSIEQGGRLVLSVWNQFK